MFKVISKHVPAASFLVVCSDLHCGEYAVQPVKDLGTTLANATQAFIAQQSLHGWVIGLDASFCPKCVAAAEAAKKLIQVPEMALRSPQ